MNLQALGVRFKKQASCHKLTALVASLASQKRLSMGVVVVQQMLAMRFRHWSDALLAHIPSAGYVASHLDSLVVRVAANMSNL